MATFAVVDVPVGALTDPSVAVDDGSEGPGWKATGWGALAVPKRRVQKGPDDDDEDGAFFSSPAESC